MKYAVIALLAASTSALRLHDLGDLNLPEVKDEHDISVDKQISSDEKLIQSFDPKDKELIGDFEKQLDQGLRNAEQGEMGRALAVSKLQTIKNDISSLAQNFNQETSTVENEVKEMLEKHQPTEIETVTLEGVNKKMIEVMSQMPKVNELEKSLEIQDEDVELTNIRSNMQKTINQAKASLEEGNKKIRDKVGAIPDAAKVLTEKQYEDQMSFVLHH